MTTSATLHLNPAPADQDLAEQARPGHGVPSQAPDPATQLTLAPQEASRETKSVLMGGGVVAGMATGAVVGVAVDGLVGVVVGPTLGAVAGALSAIAAGAPTHTRSQAAPHQPIWAVCTCTLKKAAVGAGRW